MRIVPHPLLERDIVGIAEHVHAVSGDAVAARRRIIEVRDLIAAIVEEPGLGTALGGPLTGWRVRHGGGGRRITVVFRHDASSVRSTSRSSRSGGRTGWGRPPGGRGSARATPDGRRPFARDAGSDVHRPSSRSGACLSAPD